MSHFHVGNTWVDWAFTAQTRASPPAADSALGLGHFPVSQLESIKKNINPHLLAFPQTLAFGLGSVFLSPFLELNDTAVSKPTFAKPLS